LALGHKGAVFVNIEWFGRTAHSAMPEQGDNAIYRACEAALTIRKLPLLAAEHPVLGLPTRNVGMLEGGQAPNTVPDRAWLSADVRTVPSMSNTRVIEQLRSLAGENSKLTVRYDLPAVWTDASNPFVTHCRSVLDNLGLPQTPFIGMPFFTDASVLVTMAPAPVVIVGPGEPTQAHKTDEWCLISDIHQAVSIYKHLMTTEG
jgi:succinyl-diaminopimelate desuccinylase